MKRDAKRGYAICQWVQIFYDCGLNPPPLDIIMELQKGPIQFNAKVSGIKALVRELSYEIVKYQGVTFVYEIYVKGENTLERCHTYNAQTGKYIFSDNREYGPER